jgi:hypothetical protein
MDEEKNFFDKMVGKTQPVPDLFWGILSMMIYIVAAILQQITGWFGWFLVAAGANTALSGIELLRFRLPQSSRHRSTRSIAFFMILIFLPACLVSGLLRQILINPH